MMMQTRAVLNNLRMPPRKVRLMVDLVRGLRAEDAVNQLRVAGKKAALPVKKLIESAMANAVHNHRMKKETLVVKVAFVDQGATLRRFRPRAFGRAALIKKRTGHVTVILEGEVAPEEAPKMTVPAEKKPSTKKKSTKAVSEEPKQEDSLVS